MSPKRLRTKRVAPGEGRRRRLVAEKYLEVAELIDSEDGIAINVCVGVAVLAAIAAADAICASALGERYAGDDHEAAADLLARVDGALAKHLRDVVSMKNNSHYGHQLLTASQRRSAVRSAATLVAEARNRLP